MPSADNFCKQFGPRSGLTKLFDTLMVFLKEFFKKVDFEINQQTTIKHEKLRKMPKVNITIMINLLSDMTAWFNFRNQSNSADTHQRVLLHTEIMIPLLGKVGTKQLFFYYLLPLTSVV